MGWWSDELITVPKVTFRRLVLIVEEVESVSGEDVFPGLGPREKAGQLAARILEEYVRQHFRDSTRQVAEMFDRKLKRQLGTDWERSIDKR